MVICTSCNASLLADALFCHKCGTKVTIAAASPMRGAVSSPASRGAPISRGGGVSSPASRGGLSSPASRGGVSSPVARPQHNQFISAPAKPPPPTSSLRSGSSGDLPASAARSPFSAPKSTPSPASPTPRSLPKIPQTLTPPSKPAPAPPAKPAEFSPSSPSQSSGFISSQKNSLKQREGSARGIVLGSAQSNSVRFGDSSSSTLSPSTSTSSSSPSPSRAGSSNSPSPARAGLRFAQGPSSSSPAPSRGSPAVGGSARGKNTYRKSVRQTFRQTLALNSKQKGAIERAGWERAQKGTYTRWLNHHLAKNPMAGEITEIETDLCDGTKLCDLMQIFSGKPPKSKVWRGISLPKDKFKAVENANIFLQEFSAMYPTIKLTCGPYDIVDGNYILIMGLLWQMIMAIQLDVTDFGPEPAGGARGGRPSGASTSKERVKTMAFAKANLMDWVSDRISPYGIEISDFSDSFEDGKAFQALAASIDPKYNFHHLVTNDPRFNLNSAFDQFEILGIPRLLNAEDMIGDCTPDERSIITYLAMIHSEFKNAPIISVDSKLQDDLDDDDLETFKVSLDGPGLKTAYLGKHNPFSVTVSDSTTNKVLPSGQHIEIQIQDILGCSVMVFPQNPTPQGGSVFSYIPCRPDSNVVITILFRSIQVHSISVPVVVNPASAANNFALTIEGIERKVPLGIPSSFSVLGFPKSVNPALLAHNLIGMVQGPSAQIPVTFAERAPVVDQKSWRMTMNLPALKRFGTYIPLEVGQHELFVYYDGQLKGEYFVEVTLDASPITKKSGNDQMKVGHEAAFVVTVKDAPPNIQFRVVDPEGHHLSPAVTRLDNDTFKIVFTPTLPGEYVIETCCGGQITRLDPIFAVYAPGEEPATSAPKSRADIRSIRPRGATLAEIQQTVDPRGRYPTTGTEIRPIPALMTQDSFRVWMLDGPLEQLVGMVNSSKTFMLTPTITADDVKKEMIENITRGRPQKLTSDALSIIQDEAYCICRANPDLPEEKRVRLFRNERIADVIQEMRRSDAAQLASLNLNPTKKRLPSEVDLIRRTHPSRIILTVLQVEAPPIPSEREASIYYKIYYNGQYQKSSAISASSPLKWGTEPSPFGVMKTLPSDCKIMRVKFALRKIKMHSLFHASVNLDSLSPSHELVGWFPLHDKKGDQLSARVLLSIQYHECGPWTNETSDQFLFCPAPPSFLHVSVFYPTLRVRQHDVLPVKVKVRDLQKNKELTDDLHGGELELHVTNPSGQLIYFPVHKNYPDPEVGLFYIDLLPTAAGTYKSMLKYNDQLLQHRLCTIKVKASRKKK